jgi:phenylalanyl-tRNA synthetase beta chain
MEAATWDGPNIHRTSWQLGLQTAASLRFEKQLQPEQAMEAQAVATRLMIELCGARSVPGTIDIGGDGPAPRTIALRDARVSGLLGVDIPRERSAEILRALEFGMAWAPDGLEVTVPAFRRADVTREADLIEEVARLGAAVAPWLLGTVDRAPAPAPPRRGCAGRSGAARDRRLELRIHRPRGAAADQRPARGRAG